MALGFPCMQRQMRLHVCSPGEMQRANRSAFKLLAMGPSQERTGAFLLAQISVRGWKAWQ